MKKLLYIITTMILISPNISFGFLSDSLDLDMYKKIDKGLFEMELKYYERELKSGDMSREISDTLNKNALIKGLDGDCFKNGIQLKDLNTITQLQGKLDLKGTIPYGDSQVQTIINYVKKECIGDPECKSGKDCGYSREKIAKYASIASIAHQNAINTGDKKLENTFKIARVGIYSDGIKENSSFDLMVDIQDINEIIFEKQEKYYGENNSNIGKLMEGILGGKGVDEAINDSLYPENNFFTSVIDASKTNPLLSGGNNGNGNNGNNNSKDTDEVNKDFLSSIRGNLGNSNECLTNESGLEGNSLNSILKKVNKDLLTDKIRNGGNDTSNIGNNSGNGNNNSSGTNGGYTGGKKIGFKELGGYYENLKTDFDSYKKTNDNSVWPCDNFFCITTKFVVYNNKLLGTTRDLSIEALIKRSNEHFKKFASTSLMQAKMATNNFEIGLRDINFPDMFHVGVQVTKKPVPLLWVDKEENDPDNDDFKGQNMIRDAYKSLGLDYDRANDLENFTQATKDLKTIIDCEELSIEACDNKKAIQETQSYKESIQGMVVNNYVDKKLLETDMKEFYDNFGEFETFTRQLMDYVFAVNAIVKEMNKIPQGGKN